MSCSDYRNEIEEEIEVKTIKNYVSDIENQTVWSVELEKDRLSQKLENASEFISDGKSLTKDNAKILKNFKSALYPSFSEFGSLDISNVEQKYLDFANKICASVVEMNKETLYSYFPVNYRYNCIFFLNQMAKDPDLIFQRYIIGEPFKNENLIQFPVRFYCNMGYVDVTLYLSSKQENSLYNIKIVKWEKYE